MSRARGARQGRGTRQGAGHAACSNFETNRSAARDMRTRAAPGETLAVSVQASISGAFELILGARHDADFGPQVVVGSGGVLVEILQDAQTACAPVGVDQARRMIESLRAAPLFAGIRGRPPLDADAVVDALARLSWLAADLGPRLVELDLNPVIVRRVGAGATAVDARAVVRDAPREQ